MKSSFVFFFTKVLSLFVILTGVSMPVYADSVVGIVAGFPSATGQKSDKTFSEGLSYGVVFGINGTSNYSFESGFSQLINIEDEYIDSENLEVTVSGIYLSGRYTREFSPNGFVFAKIGIYRWSADTIERLEGGSDNLDNQNSEISKKSVAGFSPMLALGADFLLGSDSSFALRVEYEYIDKIAGGVKLKSENKQRNVSEIYTYGKFSIGFLLAL